MENEVLIRQIDKLEYEELMDVLKAATKRWGALFPEWEIITLSVPKKNVAAKKAAIQCALDLIEEEGNALFLNTME